SLCLFYFSTRPPTPETSPLSLHDALPISEVSSSESEIAWPISGSIARSHRSLATLWSAWLCSCYPPSSCRLRPVFVRDSWRLRQDRKSTRLNSSHSQISYAVFCLKKKTGT